MPMENLKIRRAEPRDLSAIIALNDLAFEGEDEGRIVETLWEDDHSLLSLVAETAEGEIIGHIQYFTIDLMMATEPASFAGLGPMSVHPDRQKTGVGAALIEASLKALKEAGIQKVFVLGHPDYYPKFGFDVAETAAFSAPWGGPAFMAKRLNSGGPEFGELVYPPAFTES